MHQFRRQVVTREINIGQIAGDGGAQDLLLAFIVACGRSEEVDLHIRVLLHEFIGQRLMEFRETRQVVENVQRDFVGKNRRCEACKGHAECQTAHQSASVDFHVILQNGLGGGVRTTSLDAGHGNTGDEMPPCEEEAQHHWRGNQCCARHQGTVIGAGFDIRKSIMPSGGGARLVSETTIIGQ